VIGVANAYDELVAGIGRTRVGRSEALTLLSRDTATWRSEVIDALAGAVAQRRDAGRRRRATDASEREARGAA
jgi:hypothetical protein